ncbi:MAG: preprotein translocase subunit SecA [Candidatus Dojkabacteria bacterium]|nr:preprotein translocase subunit SecA [Candidatus Dojkabacteria bacterium]
MKKLFDSNEKQIKNAQIVVEEVNRLEKGFSKMSVEELRERMEKCRKEIVPLMKKVPEDDKSSIRARDYKQELPSYERDIISRLQELMPVVFAIIREVMKRKFNRRHFDVQILAGIILAQGNKLIEVKTGEGKTQIIHLPAALYALAGRGVHMVTVNDYLARRDGEYAGHILSELGFSVGVITPQKSYKFIPDDQLKEVKGDEVYEARKATKIINPGDVEGHNLAECTKHDAYSCDIVYGTNNEFGFDYLRDNMAPDVDRIVQGELYYCIVDEVDSVLIDESRTPLIISAPAEQANEFYQKFAGVVRGLEDVKDYTVDEKAHSAVLTDEGIEKVEKAIGVKNVWEDPRLAYHLENALKAKTLYKKDDEYIVKDGQVLIVDQFTGRVLPGRRYSEGLHQAIEAKEGVEIKKASKTLATITFQNFFRLYKVLGGCSGTVMTEAEEFYKIYNLDSVEVPTNVPVIRKDQVDRVYKNQQAKFEAVINEIKTRHEKGQPMLVGTTSVETSELLSRMLDKIGIQHEVLNAKHHEREAHIVAKAGEKGAVTIATNMAGRGTDIKLGGTDATKDEFEDVKRYGGLYVIGTERHEARRIDNQLRGRSGRQGEPGESRFFVALDDEIMRIQGGQMIQSLMERTNIPDDMPIESRLVGGAIERAQKRMEGHHFDIRNNVVKYDDVMNQQREIFYTRRRNILYMERKAQEALAQKERDDKDKIEFQKYLSGEILGEVESIVEARIAEGSEPDTSKLVDDFLDLSDDKIILQAFLRLSKDDERLKVKAEDIEKFTPRSHMIKVLKGRNTAEMKELMVKTTKEMLAAKKKEQGEGDFLNIAKIVLLQSMDQLWSDHLDAMQDLREGIGLRGVAQRDPLVEYKNEGFNYFDELMKSIRSGFVRRIFKVRKVEQQRTPVNIRTNVDQIQDMLTGSREMVEAVKGFLQNKARQNVPSNSAKSAGKSQKQETVVREAKVGRNDPCPCGSGKKYKKCCGR